MRVHLQYLKTLMVHKWYVLCEAWTLDILWRGIVHDWSKFTPSEWLPRVRALRLNTLRADDGYFDLRKADDELTLCWLRHYHRNSHHWQHYVAYLDNGTVRPLAMADADRREMLADWRAVSRRPDRQDMVPWYEQNKDHFLLHPDTRIWLEEQLYRS